MDEKAKIEAYFASHREEMVQDAMKLIRIASTRGEGEPGMPLWAGPAAGTGCGHGAGPRSRFFHQAL